MEASSSISLQSCTFCKSSALRPPAATNSRSSAMLCALYSFADASYLELDSRILLSSDIASVSFVSLLRARACSRATSSDTLCTCAVAPAHSVRLILSSPRKSCSCFSTSTICHLTVISAASRKLFCSMSRESSKRWILSCALRNSLCNISLAIANAFFSSPSATKVAVKSSNCCFDSPLFSARRMSTPFTLASSASLCLMLLPISASFFSF
mmetsp:Transcript_82234/g.133455  ORF Transcript_82234/g.133455 Transcript_82234/m.133455 type:complete len:212 (-) Transcript_82234:1630-2265(-)